MFLRLRSGKEQETNIEQQIRANSQTEDALSTAKSGIPNAPGQQALTAVSNIGAPKTGKVTVNSLPGNAEITIDNEFIGNSPAAVRLDNGTHTITVTLKGFKPWTRGLTVLPDAELTLNATLDKAAIDAPMIETTPELSKHEMTQPVSNMGGTETLPKTWVSLNGGNHTTNMELNEDTLRETEDYISSGGHRVTEDCSVKKAGEWWVGKCVLKLFMVTKSGNHVCTLELDEVVTSITPHQITGESQETLPPQKGDSCPTPAKSMVKFIDVPKN
jgi:hypothetical protein